MPESYPRDMIGYGRTPPDPRWPGEARIAVQFVLNYEEGAENSVLHGDAGSESLLTEFGFVQPRTGERYLPVESMYEYVGRAAQPGRRVSRTRRALNSVFGSVPGASTSTSHRTSQRVRISRATCAALAASACSTRTVITSRP